MDNDTARKIDALRKLLEEFPEATLCIDSEPAPKVIVGHDPGDETEPDGFHGRSYAAYLADVEEFCPVRGSNNLRYDVRRLWQGVQN